ncbi:hypothetical protein KI387_043554 [Taxus chinensis]|uniref:RING-type E3 ubiquitin transferase n=1 Tax=Taxus chinensis TaxID=29808 RepID=A0AA38BYA7_TAXCH|nr:hypothetical protein KI387_043554 [Taxus chinensis]
MSSGAGGGGGGEEEQRYWCHECETMVPLLQGAEGEVSCGVCHGSFVEEVENPPPPQGLSGREGASPMVNIGDGRVGEIINPILERYIGAAVEGPDAAGFNPMMLMTGGSNIQIVFNHGGGGGGGGGGGIRLPATMGDYYLGGGLEQLIQQLAENDPNRYGTPPASKDSVEAMPAIKITEDHLNSDGGQCAVCKDTFEEGSEARQMPCKHIYHPYCILPWLELHSTCPVCRYEMPPEESQNPSRGSNARPADATAGGATGGASGGATGVGGRRFTFQFPLRFRTAGAPQPGGSSSGQGNTAPAPNNNEEGNNNDGDQSMSEARHEDLD